MLDDDKTKKMIHYFLNIKSQNKELDTSWYASSISFKTNIQINLNEKVSFHSLQEDWQTELANDYQTRSFRVIDKDIRIHDMKGDFLNEPFVDLFLEPIYLNDTIITGTEPLDEKLIFELPTRVFNVLKNNDINSLEELRDYKKSELRKFKNLGQRSFNFLVDFCTKNNIPLSK